MDFLDSLAFEIREINKANGWTSVEATDWSNNPYRIPAAIALIHSEIVEAHDAYISASDFDEFMFELADVVIRVLDLAGGLTPAFGRQVLLAMDAPKEWTVGDTLLRLHKYTRLALEDFRHGRRELFLVNLAHLYRETVRLATSDTFLQDGREFIRDFVIGKLAKNRNRGHRHGGKRV